MEKRESDVCMCAAQTEHHLNFKEVILRRSSYKLTKRLDRAAESRFPMFTCVCSLLLTHLTILLLQQQQKMIAFFHCPPLIDEITAKNVQNSTVNPLTYNGSWFQVSFEHFNRDINRF